MRAVGILVLALGVAESGVASLELRVPDNPDSIVVLADVVEVNLKTLYFDRQHKPTEPYSALSLSIIEPLLGEFTGDKPVVSPCVAYCAGNGDVKTRTVSGQPWIRCGDRVVLMLKEYLRGGELVLMVKGTRFLSGGVTDSSRLLRALPASVTGINDELCVGRAGEVLNEYVGQRTVETEQTLGAIKSRCWEVENE